LGFSDLRSAAAICGKRFCLSYSVAIAMRFRRSTIGQVERGERNLGLQGIEKIARGLKITISELMKGV
jgi:transcriptional regulator with XRE-family HTH domain